MAETLEPDGEIEEMLVQHLVNFSWRLNRVPGIEAAILNYVDCRRRNQTAEQDIQRLELDASNEKQSRRLGALTESAHQSTLEHKAREQFAMGTDEEWMDARRKALLTKAELEQEPNRLAAAYAEGNAALGTLSRYETSLFRKLMTTMHELEDRQAKRQINSLAPRE